jgi:hypothetical protein
VRQVRYSLHRVHCEEEKPPLLTSATGSDADVTEVRNQCTVCSLTCLRVMNSTGYDNKRKLQGLLFPGGILFDKQFNNYRTPNVNSVLRLTHSISNDLGTYKKGQIRNLSDLAGLVAPPGIVQVL